MRRLFVCFALLSLFTLLSGQAVQPPRDRALFGQRVAELLHGGRVMVLALTPGQEDIEFAAYYRRVMGARVQFVYVSNGEGIESGSPVVFPNQVAADLRARAYRTASSLEAEHQFLNLPHIDAAADEDHVRFAWPSDTLQVRLRAILASFQPDLLIVNGLDRDETSPFVRSVLRGDLTTLLQILRKSGRLVPSVVAIGEKSPRSRNASLKGARTTDGATLSGVVDRVSEAYRELRPRIPATAPAYATLKGYPATSWNAVGDPQKLLRRTIPASIRSVDSVVRAVGSEVGKWRSVPRGRAADDALKRLVGALAEVDAWLQVRGRDLDPGRRVLIDRRLALESIRLQVLGVQAFWRVSDSVLTNTQLTYLTIDSVRGMDPKGTTQVYFPMVQKGWVLNEDLENRMPLSLGTDLRILSPRDMSFDLPRELAGLERNEYRTPWYFFVVHRATQEERSFSLRVDAGFLGAPRFSVDIQTPLAMASAGERLVVRLTNNSRDGVRDTLAVRDDLVKSEPMFFRMNSKGSTVIDTLNLHFSEELAEGTYFIGVNIGANPVGRFLLRKISLSADSSRPVAVLARSESNVTALAVRRLGVNARYLDPTTLDALTIDSSRVVLVPAMAADRINDAGWKTLQAYVAAGGHLAVLAQPTPETLPLPGNPVRSSHASGLFDTTLAIHPKSGDRLWSGPNDLEKESWEGWMFRRASRSIVVDFQAAEVAATVGSGSEPVVVRWQVGKGTVTYVNLNLHHQFLNVLPAAYQFLANILAY